MKKYDIIYSIGRDCACASYLQQNGLRLTSGPFDWLSENIERWQCHAIKFDEDGFPETQGNTELIQPIFSLYQLRVPLIKKVKYILLKLFAKFVCLFVPVKKWRKRIRKLYKD